MKPKNRRKPTKRTGSGRNVGNNVCAIFVHYQEQEEGYPPIAMYDIHGDHPRKNSTVTADTLKEDGISVPPTPTFKEWKSRK